MIILRQTYKTVLSADKINYWISAKAAEKIGIFNIKKYRTKLLDNGFRIRQRRFNKYQAFYPQITGKYVDFQQNKLIDIKILPSILGMIFFGIFWTVVPIIIMTLDSATINGEFKVLDFMDRLYGLGILLIIIIPMTFIFLIWPNFKAREWIESELKLEKIEKNGSS